MYTQIMNINSLKVNIILTFFLLQTIILHNTITVKNLYITIKDKKIPLSYSRGFVFAVNFL